MRKSAVLAFRFVETLPLGTVVTPDQINKATNDAPYATRAMWNLETKLGVKLEDVKDGRKITGWKIVAFPKKTPAMVTETEAKMKGEKPAKVASKKSAAPKVAAAKSPKVAAAAKSPKVAKVAAKKDSAEVAVAQPAKIAGAVAAAKARNAARKAQKSAESATPPAAASTTETVVAETSSPGA